MPHQSTNLIFTFFLCPFSFFFFTAVPSSLRIVPDILCVCECTVVSDSLRPLDCNPPDCSVHGILQGKNGMVGCHFLLQGIFLTQGSNPHLLCLLHCRWVLYPLSHWQSPYSLRTDSKFIYLTRTDSSVCTAKETINKMK